MADILSRKSAVSGKTTYQVRIRRAGFPTITKSFKVKAMASDWAREEESKLLKGLPVLTKKASVLTFNDAIKDYLEQHENVSADEASRLRTVKLDMGEMPVVNLTAPRFSAYIKTMLKSEVRPPAHKKAERITQKTKVRRVYADSTVRKFYFLIKKLVEWHARFRNYPFNHDVFLAVKAPSTDIKRTRRLVGDEEQRLFTACDESYANQQELRTVIGFALETAMRAGEIMKLEWHEVDIAKHDINIPKHKTKTERYRQVPITTVCATLLEKHKKTKSSESTRVFWQWKDSHALYQRFKIAVKNAGMTDFRFHDLRHEATSRLYERTNLRDTEIASITGHSDGRTLKRYANLRSNELVKRMW